MDGVLAAEYTMAKEYAAKNDKRRALLALRKKKFQEGLIAKVDLQLVTLEEMVCFDSSHVERETIDHCLGQYARVCTN